MQIDHIPLERLSVSKANMRGARKVPDVSDILPSIARRGVLSPLFVRPNCQPGHFEIVAGKTHAAPAALRSVRWMSDFGGGEIAAMVSDGSPPSGGEGAHWALYRHWRCRKIPSRVLRSLRT